MSNGDNSLRIKGFTLVELLIVVALIAIVSAVAIPAVNSYRDQCGLRAAAMEICGMIREAKQKALVYERTYSVGFNTASGIVSLIAERGPDGKWNTADDKVERYFALMDKGGVRFGYGLCGPLPTLAQATDGVTFQYNNTLECNPNLSGNGGTAYLISPRGAAMAIVMNTTDFGYKLWRWNGKQWVRM
ncbi:MAG: prepilin-type N-terminal cleavage/methylation domain-containing protein [Geobacter sp.]|nr:MAG: prepilin-type N-terminal cleavage/methylation domain-containing protein [Geobacter sp.]